MGDQFEKFILDKKEAFNDEVPSHKTWNEIDQKLSKSNNIIPLIWKIAAVLFMISTIYLIADRASVNQEGPFYSEEFTQAEDYYVSQINQRRAAIEGQLTPEQQEEFLSEIDQLDVMYADLKNTYSTNSSNERVSDAMISNLQLRLEILNKQLEILQNIKNQNNEKDKSIEI